MLCYVTSHLFNLYKNMFVFLQGVMTLFLAQVQWLPGVSAGYLGQDKKPIQKIKKLFFCWGRQIILLLDGAVCRARLSSVSSLYAGCCFIIILQTWEWFQSSHLILWGRKQLRVFPNILYIFIHILLFINSVASLSVVAVETNHYSHMKMFYL